jgi:hypothetical protein
MYMSKWGKAVNDFTPLKAPVPPMLATALGYTGNARFVSFQWMPYRNAVEYYDGRRSDIGNGQAYLVYIQHPAISPFLASYDLGPSASQAHHTLILDREQHQLFLAPVADAEQFLREQWRETQGKNDRSSRYL